MSVKVHYADPLYPTLHLLHPLVRIHVLDYKTAKPLPSTLGDARYSTIQPLLTEPFDLRVNKTMSPCWEEQILVPEHYNSIITNDNAMLFFEVNILIDHKFHCLCEKKHSLCDFVDYVWLALW